VQKVAYGCGGQKPPMWSKGRESEGLSPEAEAFYPRDATLARVIEIATCLSVCPSVRPSRAGIVSKQRKLAA